MDKRIVSFVGVAVLAVSAVASGQVTGGLKVGLNDAGMSQTPEPTDGSVTLSNRQVLLAGGFFEVPLARHIAIQPEVLFVMKGRRVSINQAGLTADSTAKFTSLDVPVLVRVDVPTRGAITPYLYAGPNIGFVLTAKAVTTLSGSVTTPGTSQETDVKDTLKSTEVGVAVGGGVRLGRLLAELRYTRGLTNILADPGSSGVKVTNHALAVIGGVRF